MERRHRKGKKAGAEKRRGGNLAQLRWIFASAQNHICRGGHWCSTIVCSHLFAFTFFLYTAHEAS